MEIREASTHAELNQVHTLAQAFISFLQQVYPEAHDLFDRDAQAVEGDFPSLPGAFGSAKGKVLIACSEGNAIGMVALQDMGQGLCEMKHMFVDPAFRARGMGRALALALIDGARAEGYVRMRLSTGTRQEAALRLYRNLGFKEIAPFNPVHNSLQPFLVFMELWL